MPYAPLPRITLQDALSETHPLFPDTCPCVGCIAYNAAVGLPVTPQAPIVAKSSESTRAPANRGALFTSQVDVLIERVVRKYGG